MWLSISQPQTTPWHQIQIRFYYLETNWEEILQLQSDFVNLVSDDATLSPSWVKELNNGQVRSKVPEVILWVQVNIRSVKVLLRWRSLQERDGQVDKP